MFTRKPPVGSRLHTHEGRAVLPSKATAMASVLALFGSAAGHLGDSHTGLHGAVRGRSRGMNGRRAAVRRNAGGSNL